MYFCQNLEAKVGGEYFLNLLKLTLLLVSDLVISEVCPTFKKILFSQNPVIIPVATKFYVLH